MSAAKAANAPFLLQWTPASLLAVFGIWTGLVVLSVAGGALAYQQMGREFNVWPYTLNRAADWYSCAIFTPVYIWLAVRRPIERATWKTRVPLWLGLTAVIVPLKFVVQHAAMGAIFPDVQGPPLRRIILSGYVPETIAFWAMIAVMLSIVYYGRWRDREVHAHALARQLAEARLEVLAAQLRPHFLFNTLQGISTLLHRDPQAADQMLTRLSDLLRDSLRQSETPEVPLSEELATLEHYLAIQRVRFEDRLHVGVSAVGAGEALVPHFILQPLVENAIEHGIARRAGPGRVDVSARVTAQQLILEVTDDGAPGATAVPRVAGGIGLANTRARLEAMFGGDASLTAAPRADGGFAVTIVMPLRHAAANRE